MSSPVSPSFVGAHSPDVHAVDIADEAVLLHEPTGELHLLNPTGALVWRCLDGRSTVAEIAADIAEVGGVPQDRVVADMVELLTELVAGDLVVEGSAR